ncbi:phosphoadenosine phosphosulfate reductase family protein [Nocardiopsis metallicus]|jgi:3'-phosphoadenosine 5'-phosphosulfate sulfotransferase (PAPS reductase)/FAD synthetase|uniref:3'-phosphoadenosine 5'-phosphosulfate sulfotransferase (PAPS reductase)/FAD synthetase n=1 Tax=Nocardiopsis metallicus TaxID=179819 RepID=A0A840WXF5_9ACTN|nr:phosphoadenosine phosphosulfate reductase family protein [Nocardiopsis metallicus]MBB5494858.1 3'-phosphoadenosine 5'-phosphosulfate sulfotransferase (PAPS reductase)/FAD synthetase [Nocardiopsis metallicus]
MTNDAPAKKVRHVLGISGGKDSSSLAIYMRDRVPDMEYFFCDTGAELPETYEYLNRLEAALGKSIVRLNADRDFDHWMEVYQGTLPSPQMRWCTKNLKLKPLEEWVGEDEVISYVAIRADENRLGYVSTKPNIKAVFPFREDGIDRSGVDRILDEAGIGLPDYYEWRTRSGCYFCFFQRKHEWLGLKDRHPDLFDKAVAYEEKVRYRHKAMQGRDYTWTQGESLTELVERREEIEERHKAAMERAAKRAKPNRPLLEVLSNALDEDDDEAGCSVCHL